MIWIQKLICRIFGHDYGNEYEDLEYGNWWDSRTNRCRRCRLYDATKYQATLEDQE